MRISRRTHLPKLLFLITLLIPLAETKVDGRLEVYGNFLTIAANNSSFSADNYTDFGTVFNRTASVDYTQLSRTFVLVNGGSSNLVISEIRLEDEQNFFDITTSAVGTLSPNESAELVINFNSRAFGLAFAEVVIESNDPNGSFRFFIRAKNVECNSTKCFGKLPSDPTVCNSFGTCIGQNTCSCAPLYAGTNCQTPIRWNDGNTLVQAGHDFSPRITIGPELTDPNEVYRIKVAINKLSLFQDTEVSIGVGSSPPGDLAHDIGQIDREYGYLSSGRLYSNGVHSDYGIGYGEGDVVLIIYDLPQNKLSFAVKKAGTHEFLPQGEAFTGLIARPGKSLHLMLSLTCFGECELELVD
jgi:hypothetical protein